MNIVRRFCFNMVHDIGRGKQSCARAMSTKAAMKETGSSGQTKDTIRHSYEVRHYHRTISTMRYGRFWFVFRFQEAIATLNSLQTNSSTISKSVSQMHNTTCTHIEETQKFLERSGLKLETLDNLSVIHVSGTKGKVSENLSFVVRRAHSINVLYAICSGLHMCDGRVDSPPFECENRLFQLTASGACERAHPPRWSANCSAIVHRIFLEGL